MTTQQYQAGVLLALAIIATSSAITAYDAIMNKPVSLEDFYALQSVSDSGGKAEKFEKLKRKIPLTRIEGDVDVSVIGGNIEVSGGVSVDSVDDIVKCVVIN